MLTDGKTPSVIGYISAIQVIER